MQTSEVTFFDQILNTKPSDSYYVGNDLIEKSREAATGGYS